MIKGLLNNSKVFQIDNHCQHPHVSEGKGAVQKGPSSKATGTLAPGAYTAVQYVRTTTVPLIFLNSGTPVDIAEAIIIAITGHGVAFDRVARDEDMIFITERDIR